MKKVIAFAIMFALLATAAFAQVAATVETRMYAVDMDLDDTDTATTYGAIHTASFTFTGANDDGTIGGKVKFKVENITGLILGETWANGGRFHQAFVWWRPIPQLRVFLGMDPDGLFDSAVLAGWNYHQGNEQFIGFQYWDFWREVFPGNWDTFGMAFSYFPIQGVNVNLVIPTGGPSVDTWPRHHQENVFRKVPLKDMYPWGLRLNANVRIPDVGTAYFSWAGPENFAATHGGDEKRSHYGQIGGSFLMSGLVQGVQAQLGFSTKIPRYSEEYFPFLIGAAAVYSGPAFGVKFRTGVAFNANINGNGNVEYDEDHTYVHGSLMPFMNVGKGRLNVDVGITALAGPDETLMGWWFSPYYTIGPFQAGIHLFTTGKGNSNAAGGYEENAGYAVGQPPVKDNSIKFAIPIRMVFSF